MRPIGSGHSCDGARTRSRVRHDQQLAGTEVNTRHVPAEERVATLAGADSGRKPHIFLTSSVKPISIADLNLKRGEQRCKISLTSLMAITAAWEQRKLGELISSLETGKSVNSTDDIPAEGDVSILKTSCVSSDYFDQTEVKQVVEQERNLVKCPVEADTIIVSRMNTPERVGACGYVASTCPNVYLPDRLWKLTVSNGCDAYLLYTLLASGPRKAQIKGMASGTSGSMHNVPQGPFLELDLLLPQYNEQGKIGRYFRNLDHLITLHQCASALMKTKRCIVRNSSLCRKTAPQRQFCGAVLP